MKIETGRPVTRAPSGMVSSPHSLASEAGVAVLRSGGSAVDAAIATSAVLAVAYPHMTSIGGDAFWLIHDGKTGDVRYLNGGGRAAAGATLDWFKSAAYEQEGLVRDLIAKYFNETSRRFIDALANELPTLTSQDLYFRFHFLPGARYYTVLNPGRMRDLSGGACDPADSEKALAAMIAFFAAGLRTPGGFKGSVAKTISMEMTR